MGGGKPCLASYSDESVMITATHQSTTISPEGTISVNVTQSNLEIKDASGDWLFLYLNSSQRQALLAALQAADS